MLYVVPASSALHLNSPYPHYSYRRQPYSPFVPSCSNYYDYSSGGIGQGVLAREDLWPKCNQEQNLLHSYQIEQPDYRSLYQSIYAAEQREIAHRRKQEQAELIRALAIVAARRKQAEDAARYERAAIEYRRQRELNEYLKSLFAQVSADSAATRPPSAPESVRFILYRMCKTCYLSGL
jgi:hypothetical protein